MLEMAAAKARAGAEEEVRDAAHEGHTFAVGFAQVHVVAACLGHHGAELRKADARKEGNQAADGPYEKRQTEIAARAFEDDAADIKDA